jgi:hypothetical protein
MSDNPSQRPTRCCKNQRRLLAPAPSCVGSLPMPDRALAANLATRVRAVGIRAAVGVPVIVDGRVWGLAAVGSARSGPMPADTEVRISGFVELVGGVVVAGYRDEQKRQLLGGVSQRPLLVGSLLEGRSVDRWGSWEVARCLRLPAGGPFVVIAAEVPAVGSEALPAVESTLRGLLLDNSISPTSGGARRCCRTQQRLQCVIRGDIDGGVQRTQRLNSIVGHQLWK